MINPGVVLGKETNIEETNIVVSPSWCLQLNVIN